MQTLPMRLNIARKHTRSANAHMPFIPKIYLLPHHPSSRLARAQHGASSTWHPRPAQVSLTSVQAQAPPPTPPPPPPPPPPPLPTAKARHTTHPGQPINPRHAVSARGSQWRLASGQPTRRASWQRCPKSMQTSPGCSCLGRQVLISLGIVVSLVAPCFIYPAPCSGVDQRPFEELGGDSCL